MALSLPIPQLPLRINSLDLTRCTEQCAILASLFIGRGETRTKGLSSAAPKPGPSAVRHQVARRWAIKSLMGYLHDSYCNGRLVHIYPNHERVRTLWGHATAHIGRYADRPDALMDLDLVAAPVDGTRDLLKGRDGGSISVIAGGARECFVSAQDMASAVGGKVPQWFFVLATRSNLPEAENLVVAQDASRPVSIADVLGQSKLIERALVGETPKNRLERVVGALGLERPTALRNALRGYARLRTLQGSSVAAAITAFLPSSGLDAYADIVNLAPVVLMAAAARATGGELYAIPLVSTSADHVAPNTTVWRSDFFVRGDDVFLAATGITENLILKGVRFPKRGRASTHTICLRSGTGSVRFVTQDHDLKRKRFRLLEESRGKQKHTTEGYDLNKYREIRYADVLQDLK